MARIYAFLTVVLLGLVHAQAQADIAGVAPADSAAQGKARTVATPIVPRAVAFDAQEIAKLKADPANDYDRDLHVETLWWDRLKHWLGEQFEKLFGSKAGRWIFNHLDKAILLVAIGLLLFYFRKRLLHGGFALEPARQRQALEIGEDLPREDLDRLLAGAERDGQWRLALRYQYLAVLRRLIDDGSIRFQPGLTDRDYLRQLQDPAQRKTFSELSFLFKWAWFGDAPLDEARYRSLVPGFSRFHTPALKP